ncbi:hypothetical protein MACH10_37200 [Thalassospira tepidiphila]|uniref:hypothetical protein n=1 Tax=Thalassospira tepidiphila TaxID=393657 RepID=UPI002923E060|nr:hypothetical protein MACH10_37200 [Thalassospira tepidiphila]
MSIGENWRQISPGSLSGGAGGAGGTNGAANGKFAQSNAADQLSGTSEGRTFSQYMFGEDGFEFTDFLDVINPLQHIPGVGMIYRSLTGDEIGNGARVAGGGLFGGVFGLAGAAIDAVVDAVTGDDTGTHFMAMVEDGFGGSGLDDGTAVADAGNANAPTSQATTVAQNGAYQGDLVLPWMTGPQSQSVSPAEQATIVQSAPTAPVDQAMLASNAAPGSTGVQASDLNVPWAQGAQVAQNTQNASPVAQAAQSAASKQPEAELASASVPPSTDPAELTVAMASAGTANPVSAFNRTVASNSTATETARRPVTSTGDANTVWARAASSGRLSRQTNGMAISAEMAAHEAKYAKLNAVKAETAERKASDIQTTSPDGTPLSAAEMAARFNAALGRDKAQTMAADAVASSNAVADDRPETAQDEYDVANTDQGGSAISASAPADDAPADHPLLQQASDNLNGDAPVGAWFSQTMMDGLKKYQAMQQKPSPSGNAI